MPQGKNYSSVGKTEISQDTLYEMIFWYNKNEKKKKEKEEIKCRGKLCLRKLAESPNKWIDAMCNTDGGVLLL